MIKTFVKFLIFYSYAFHTHTKAIMECGRDINTNFLIEPLSFVKIIFKKHFVNDDISYFGIIFVLSGLLYLLYQFVAIFFYPLINLLLVCMNLFLLWLFIFGFFNFSKKLKVKNT